MNNSNHTENHVGNVFILTAGILTAAIGFLALLGWVLGLPLLASYGSRLMPMSPSTALLLVLFGAAVFFRNRFPRHRGTYLMSIFIGSLVTVTSLLLFFFSSAGTYPPIENLGFSITGSLDGIPIGHMSPSPVAVICLVVSAMSFLLTLSPSVERPTRAVAALVLACLTVLTASLHLIAYSFGSPLMHGGRIIPLSLPSSLAILILALGLLVAAGLQIWPYSRMKDSATARVSYVLFLIFVILAAGIVTGGYFAYRNYEKNYRQEVEYQLSAIAELKVNQLVQYRAERLGDASILFKNPSFSNLVRRFFGKANDADAQHQLQAWLGKYKSHYQYHRVFLLDTLGVTRMSVPKVQEPNASTISNRASEILISREAAIQDFYRNENDRKIYLSVLVPILDEQHSNRPIGILVLVIDPAGYLYPLIQYWPTPSRTSESLIIRREGNDALFLNELRFQKNTALTLRSPLTNVAMPAVQAILGKEGTVEGIDYRGVPVLANVRHIPNSPWFLVARMDISEIYAPVRERLWQIILFIGVLLIGASAGVGLVWRHQRAGFYREKFLSSEALRVSEEKYRRLFENINTGVAVYEVKDGGRDFIFKDFNHAGEKIDNDKRERLIGRSVIEVRPGIKEFGLLDVFKRVWMTGNPEHFPVRMYKDDRLSGWYDNFVYKLPSGEIVAVFENITGRKKEEESLRESEMRLRIAQQVAHIGVGDWNIQTGVNTWTPELEALYGLPPGGFPGTQEAFTKLVHPDDLPEVERRVEEAMMTGDFEGEWRIIWPDGTTHWLAGRTKIFKDESGKALQMLGINIDITERKQLEEALKINEALFRELFDNMKSGSTIFTAMNDGSKGSDYVIKKMNRAGLQMEGKALEEVVGKRFIDIRPTIDSYGLIPVMKKVWETGKSAIFPTKIYRDERYSNYYENYIFKLPSGEVVTLYDDVTESKRAEDRLRESEERFRAIALNTPDHILVQDLDLRYSFVVNPQLGLTEADMIGKTDFNFLGKEEAEALTAIKRRVLETAEPFHLEVPLRDLKGETQFFEGSFIAKYDSTGKVDGLIGYFRNITERKKAEGALKEANAELTRAQRIAHIGSWNDYLPTQQLDWSEEMYHIFGFPPNMPVNLAELIHVFPREELERFQKAVGAAINTDVPYSMDYKINRPDGAVRYIHDEGEIVRDEQGKAIWMHGTTQDITERKQAEIQIQFQANLLTNVSDAILATDRQFNIQYWNTAAEKQYGWTSAEVLGRHFMKLIQPQYVGDSRTTVMRKIVQEGSWTGELLHNRSDGTLFPVHVTISEIRNAEGEIIGHIAINRDITERKRTQEEIRNSHEQLLQLTQHQNLVREDERARISREIHDELGQSLTALKIDLNWVREHVAKKPAVRQRLNAMLDIADSTIKDVQRIASELRPSILDDLGLTSAIEWYCEEFEKRSGIICQTDLEETQFKDTDKDLAMFRILQEALTNISRHANATTVMVHLCRLGENLNLEIKDDGIGISQEKMIAGQSLGLIGMRERVRQFNGRFEIVSEEKKGTTIRISLPIHS